MTSNNKVLRRSFQCQPVANKDAIVAGDKYRFTILTDGLVRYEWAADGIFEDRASTFATRRNLPVPNFQVVRSGDDTLEIITDRFHLTYDGKPFSPSSLTVDVKGRVSRVTQLGCRWHYGCEDKSLGGTARTLDDADGRIPLGPGVVSKMGYASIDDSKSMLFDDKGWIGSRREGDRSDGYLFAYGLDYKAAVRALYAVSGSQPLLPRWALGNWWSRYYPYAADEYLALMDRFHDEGIPLSVAVIDMDWHLVHSERVTHSGWTGYTWEKKLFPDPKAFCEALHERDLKITLNDHPSDGVHAFEDAYEAMARELGRDTSSVKNPIQFDPTDSKFFDAYFDVLHRKIENDGCDFWWIDWQHGSFSRTKGIDPLWMLNHFHFLDNQHTGEPLILSRYAGPGSHRYPIGFSGDTLSTWASLDFQPEFTATASNIGYGWWSHDIGGHLPGGKNDDCLTRWLQLGVFSPIMRLHSTDNIWMSKEPWKFREESRVSMSHFLRFRHRLLPYLYSMNVSAAWSSAPVAPNDGLPIVQPIYWHYPRRNEAYTYRNQFFFGSELMVAPITKARNSDTGLASTKAWLPPGRCVDLFTGTVYNGDRVLSLYRPLSQYPVFAYEGAIIPLDAAMDPLFGGRNPLALELYVVVGADGKFRLDEDASDDAPTIERQATKKRPRRTTVVYEQATGSLSFTAIGSKRTATREWTIHFLSLTSIPPTSVKALVDGAEHENCTVTVTKTQYVRPPGLTVKLLDVPVNSLVSVSLGTEKPQLDVIDHRDEMSEIINQYQIQFGLKDQIWNLVGTDDLPTGTRISGLMNLGLEEVLLGPVAELLLADSGKR